MKQAMGSQKQWLVLGSQCDRGVEVERNIRRKYRKLLGLDISVAHFVYVGCLHVRRCSQTHGIPGLGLLSHVKTTDRLRAELLLSGRSLV